MANALLSTSIGKKFLVGLTGLFLVTFLVVHLGINLCILIPLVDPFDQGETFNAAAHFMSNNWVIRVMEIGLLLGILTHIIMTLKLHFENKSKRPVEYAVSNQNPKTKWYSKSMTLLGTLLLIFLVIHMGNFWVESKKHVYILKDEHNAFEMVKSSLSIWWMCLIYIFGFFSLGFHLLHGFPSAFQTLGLNHKKYTPIIQTIGTAFSLIVPALFAVIALVVYFKLV